MCVSGKDGGGGYPQGGKCRVGQTSSETPSWGGGGVEVGEGRKGNEGARDQSERGG